MQTLPFPSRIPDGYEPLVREPCFDPSRHLALEAPARTWTLEEFGYGDDVVRAMPSPVAAAGPFRVLSREGVEAVQDVCRALKTGRELSLGGNRTSAYVHGATYRSRFLRDLCNSPDVASFLSEIAETELVPHSMPSQQVYINYAPDDLTKAVDNWHVDSIGFDCVLMVSDPAGFAGGRFQVFRGSMEQAAALLATTTRELTEGFLDDLPDERVEEFAFPGPGWAVFQQGHLVLHRATRLEAPGERITLVPGYVSPDASKSDPTNVERITGWGEPGILAELARHAAWRSRNRLDGLVATLPMTDDSSMLVASLREAITDIDRLVSALSGSSASAGIGQHNDADGPNPPGRAATSGGS